MKTKIEMKKELPKPKKTLKTFILEEDAKIIKKSVTKIALMITSFAIISGCSKHTNHANYSILPTDDFSEYSEIGVVTKDPELTNENIDNEIMTYSKSGRTIQVEIAGKGVGAVHANHFNG